jgi:beta-glucanase (GH16 family)
MERGGRSRFSRVAAAGAAATALIALACGCGASSGDARPGAHDSVVPAGSNGPAVRATGASTEGWRLTADDEFDGTRLNGKLWSIGEPWNAPPGFVESDDAYCPIPQTGEVTVGDGSLHLNALAVKAHGKPLQSCFITTRNKFSFTHGYIETRFKLPTSPGLWSAFWLLGNGTGAQGWPKTGEIDMFEFINNGRANRIPFFTVHWAGA